MVNTEDTFATACHLLKIRRDPQLDGKPVMAMFDKQELLETPQP